VAFSANSNAEGWRITEQMVIDEAYADQPKYRLAQIQTRCPQRPLHRRNQNAHAG
jgi:hypothetical protein